MLKLESMSQTSKRPPLLTTSVIIPVRNGGLKFRQCLISVTKALLPSTELIVVSDGSEKGDCQVAGEWGAKVLEIPQPQGPARARNLGAQNAKGDILFFMDADVVIPPDSIHKIEASFRNDPQLTALFGSYDETPFEKNFLSQYKNLFHHYIHQTSREEASTFWAGCGAIRRRVFIEMGGFNEAYRRPCIEDIEFGYRLKRAGYRIHLLKDLQVTHLKRWNLLRLLKSDFFDRAIPWTELILRDRYLINDLNLKFTNRISGIITYILLATVIIGFWSPLFWIIAMVSGLSLFIINLPLYRFFLNRRGIWFTLGTLTLHWLYYLYSVLAFIIALGRFLLSRPSTPKIQFSSLSSEQSHPTSFQEWS